MTAISGVIFDKDGTLFDFSKTWVSWATAILEGIASDNAHAGALGRAIGFDVDNRRFEPGSVVIAGTPVEVVEAMRPLLPEDQAASLLNYINQEAENAPQAEVLPLRPFVSGLKQDGYLLGVVTNDAEAPAMAHLEAAGVRTSFDFIAGSDSGWGAKPDPGQLLACARALQLEPGDMVMVGDSTHDLMAAERAGMRRVAVLTGMAPEAVLAPYAEVVLPDIGHLRAWLSAQMQR